jgi:hypothetical protein
LLQERARKSLEALALPREQIDHVLLSRVDDAAGLLVASSCVRGEAPSEPGRSIPSWRPSPTAIGPITSLIPQRPTMPRAIW